jgi:SAM-dependent methyltransferase/spore coat polysaccharide biosynthesis predicted glycosyltransferase SpsG
MNPSMKQPVDPSVKPVVLFCPAAGPEHGIGHLKRCLTLIEAAGGLYDPVVCFLDREPEPALVRMVKEKGAKLTCSLPGEKRACGPHLPAGARVSLIVSDMRDTTGRTMDRLLKIAPVLSLDDMGAGRRKAHLTVLSLPTVRETGANYTGTRYLVLGSMGRSPLPKQERSGDIVVSFGGSDPHNLSDLVTSVLNDLGVHPVVITGPLYTGRVRGECRIIHAPRDAADIIRRGSLLITSFGVTLYEALLMKTPVVLINHSRYHSQVAGSVPVPDLGWYPECTSRLREKIGGLLENRDALERRAEENAALVDGQGARRLNSIILRACGASRATCIHGHRGWDALKRYPGRTLFKCGKCGDLFQFVLRDENEAKPGYGASYFGSQYRKQYGRTYLKDRPGIRSLAQRRLDLIERFAPRRGSLLDAGCALGFFLEAARERGWTVRGVEVSEYAVAWARNRLGLDVVTGSFAKTTVDRTFQAVTLFYVAEHLPCVEEVIEKAYDLLEPGGIIVLALPNRGGISWLMNRKRYIDQHPSDHYFDTTPRGLSRFLDRQGFRRLHIETTGIHPERFFQPLGLNFRKGSRWERLAYGVYALFAGWLRLGDTFEYYGNKL